MATAGLPIVLSMRDTSIECKCSERARIAKDLAFRGVGRHGPSFIHLPCHPHASALANGRAFDITAVENALSLLSREQFSSPENVILAIVGANPTAEQRVKVKNFISTFLCDGPCQASQDIREYYMCRKCCSWQHRLCMLYGDTVNYDDVVRAQRKQLVLAVKDAYLFLINPAHKHQEWRRDWCKKFIARFMEENRGHFRRWLDGYRAKQQSLQMLLPPHSAAASGPESNKPAPRKRKAASKQARVIPLDSSGDDDDDADGDEFTMPIADEDDDVDDANYRSSDDEYSPQGSVGRVTRKTTTRTRSIRNQTRTKRSMLKKNLNKRKAESPRSLSPPPLDSQIYMSSAPRKSVRKDDQARRRVNTDEEDIAQEYATVTRRISCTCGTTPDRGYCFKCKDCDLLQHEKCAHDNEDGLPVQCNFCFNPGQPMDTSAVASPEESRSPNLSAPDARTSSAAATDPNAVDQATLQEADQVCATIMWKRYSNLANVNMNTNPPSDWLETVQGQFRKVLTAAGNKDVQLILGIPLSIRPWPAHQIMNGIGEIVIKVLHHGAFKGKPRAELGLLLEIVGLEKRGTHWKGG